MKSRKLRREEPTPLQADALGRMARMHPPLLARLVRTQGGFWTTPDLAISVAPGAAPAWNCGTRTVEAMEARGWVEPADPRRWAPRRLTDAGRLAVSRPDPAPSVAACTTTPTSTSDAPASSRSQTTNCPSGCGGSGETREGAEEDA